MNIYFEKHTTRTPPAAIDNANIGNLFITERKFPFFLINYQQKYITTVWIPLINISIFAWQKHSVKPATLFSNNTIQKNHEEFKINSIRPACTSAYSCIIMYKLGKI